MALTLSLTAYFLPAHLTACMPDWTDYNDDIWEVKTILMTSVRTERAYRRETGVDSQHHSPPQPEVNEYTYETKRKALQMKCTSLMCSKEL